jgi:methylmalonyl-CoA mutase N-terminal domain/subunit
MDPEYAVIGRVCRRIWAIAMRDMYGVDERGQKLNITYKVVVDHYTLRNIHGMIIELHYKHFMH